VEEKETRPSILRKIDVNRKYRIWRKDYNGQTYYNIQIVVKQFDGEIKKYYIPVTFKKGVEVQNESDIKIIKAIENIRENKNVESKLKPYSPIFSYMINEFEYVENKELNIQNAYDEYRENLSENEMVDISDNFLD
jgi:hypothetical protein